MKRFVRLDGENAFKVGGTPRLLSLLDACLLFSKDFCFERVP